MPNEISSRVGKAILERVFPGCVIGVVQADGSREVSPYGSLAYDDEPVREDTVYDLASITKSIPLASLGLMLSAAGKFTLSDKVAAHLPELHNDFGATIEDLLRYRVVGGRMSSLAHLNYEEIGKRVCERGFDGPPADSHYSNLPAFVLGMVIARVAGEPLEKLAQSEFFEPLGMRHTTFFPNATECAPTEVVEGKELRGVVHDESACVFSRARRTVGHAGLFSTAGDLLNFAHALLSEKLPAVLDGAQQGLGWQREGDFLGSRPGSGAFGKTGFTGTSIAIDVRRGIGFVILSNRTYPHRPADGSAINSLRKDIADVFFGMGE